LIRIKQFFLFFFLVSLFYKSDAQQYDFLKYNVQEGMAHSQVSSILQDTDGYLWFATFGGGVSRFDGKTFINYSEKEGLSSNLIRSAIIARNGNLFFGTTGGGVCMFDGKKFRRLNDSVVKMSDVVSSLSEDAEGNIWIGSNNGVFRYNGKILEDMNAQLNISPEAIKLVYCDKKNRVWISVWDKGLYCFANKKVQRYTFDSGAKKRSAISMFEDKNGNIWIGTQKGVCRVKETNGSIKIVDHKDGSLNEFMIYSIIEDKSGDIWFGTQGAGLIRYDSKSKSSQTITMVNGLPGNAIPGLMKDREGNIWISCWGYGVLEYISTGFVHYSTTEGLTRNSAGRILQDGNSILVNTGDAVNVINGSSVSVFKEKFSGKINDMCKSPSGILWVAGAEGLMSYENNKIRSFSNPNELGAFPPTSITSDSKGNVWCSSEFGKLSCYNGQTFKNYSVGDGLKSDYIYFIHADKKDNIWICTWASGLCKFDGKRFVYYTKKEGLPSDNVMVITEDQHGNFWIGTYGGGISFYDGKQFRTISRKDGLNDDGIVALVFDDSHYLWASTSKGLNRIDVSQFASSGKVSCRVYGKTEGFREIEGSHNSAFKEVSGNLWFGSKNGIARYNRKEEFVNNIEPLTHITSVKLFFEETDWSLYSDSVNHKTGMPNGLSLDHQNDHLSFSFIGISTTIPEKVRYRYMLGGVDKDWSPPTDKTDITYSGLAPGAYVFKVIACNNEGIYNKVPVTFQFTIKPPFWQRTWFYLICILLVIFGFYIYVKLRTKKLENEKKLLEDKVAERTIQVVKQKDELEVAYHEIEVKNNIVEQKNKDITDSINYAKRIQYTLLANEELLKNSIPDHFVFFQPKDIVSGDFYWATKKGDRFYLAVCDSTGHGVPGAFMSLLNISFLNEAVNEKNISSPDMILNYVRERLISSVSKDGAQDGMDGILLCIDSNSGDITYAAAHNQPLIVRDKTVIELFADKMPVGKGEKQIPFALHRIEKQPGDMLYLYTDGYADQFGGKSGKKFKYKQLQKLLADHSGKPLQEQQDIVLKTINDWKGNLEQVDDILLIGIKL
jgi:ligand-binding sensor domain-containing protein/serine phosphatase RsbU (regulator of sigma subunit)